MTPEEIEACVLAYAAKRGIKKTAAIEEIALILDCKRYTLFRWMKGNGQPTPWEQTVFRMFALPPNSPAKLNDYMLPTEGELKDSLAASEIMRRKVLAAAALAGVEVQA